MKSIFPGLALTLALFFSACKKDLVSHPDINTNNVLTFWVDPGEGIPFTARFTLTHQHLLDKDGQFLPDSLFQIAQVLNQKLPAELCASDTDTPGCAPCSTWTSVYLQTDCNGQQRTWRIDPFETGQPDKIDDFARLVHDVYFKLW